MTKHLVSADVLREGETAEEWFRRMARDKPRSILPCKPCAYCGGDHRGPSAYWPDEERQAHVDAGGPLFA